MIVYLAFQKIPDNNFLSKIFFKLISWKTKSKYAHIEIFFDDIFVSSTFRKGIEIKALQKLSPKYDYYKLKVDGRKRKQVYRFLEQIRGAKYDWKGIFQTHLINLNKQNKKKYFCSEVVAEILNIFRVKLIKLPHQYTPQDIFNELEQNLEKY